MSRQAALQASCFAGVAISGMRSDTPSWQRYRSLYVGRVLGSAWVTIHGKLSTQLRWLEKGYRSGEPGACNTWTAAKRAVT
ncbi:hypothetical protein Psi02_66900 [Planotetraspora silvatica]|uniref:Uncharacterized protein n=1 Tax=Planotetraspora silvatica TaxID=234614 RepID=A0A8J3UVI1_9ACTN|nr:hypothetical protein Psi02_66900 [Planotetraspora silvatica]